MLTLRRASMALHPANTSTDIDLYDIAAGLAATTHHVCLDDGDATRRFARVLSTSEYDAWIIRWSESAELGLHDHGNSTGIVHVVDGELVETRVDEHHPTSQLRSRTLRQGDVARIDPNTIHAVANVHRTEALSVHVYSPPLSQMTFYDVHP